jgi:hypothetical protein
MEEVVDDFGSRERRKLGIRTKGPTLLVTGLCLIANRTRDFRITPKTIQMIPRVAQLNTQKPAIEE